MSSYALVFVTLKRSRPVPSQCFLAYTIVVNNICKLIYAGSCKEFLIIFVITVTNGKDCTDSSDSDDEVPLSALLNAKRK